MNLINIKQNVLSMELLAVFIFQSKSRDNEIEGVEIDVKPFEV